MMMLRLFVTLSNKCLATLATIRMCSKVLFRKLTSNTLLEIEILFLLTVAYTGKHVQLMEYRHASSIHSGDRD